MDGAILALVAPLLMKGFSIDLDTYRSGVQIALRQHCRPISVAVARRQVRATEHPGALQQEFCLTDGELGWPFSEFLHLAAACHQRPQLRRANREVDPGRNN
jgi:hypothetical protein